MPALDSLEYLLAQALECLDEAAGLVREIESLETPPNLRFLGDAIFNTWELRAKVHLLRPDLKPTFVLENEENKIRYEQLAAISDQALAAEKSNDFETSEKLFQQLRQSAQTGFFRLIAESGLYRLWEHKNGV